MAEVGDERSIAHTRDELLEEHQKIRGITEGIENAHDLNDLLRRLEEFRSLIEPHFGGEEAAGGFFDVVRSMAPRHLGRIAQLETEHRQLLSEIDRLAERARACLEGPVAEILRGAGDLAGRLHAHEARENELLIDAMYTDIGHGD